MDQMINDGKSKESADGATGSKADRKSRASTTELFSAVALLCLGCRFFLWQIILAFSIIIGNHVAQHPGIALSLLNRHSHTQMTNLGSGNTRVTQGIQFRGRSWA